MRKIKKNVRLTPLSQNLRKDMTKEERHLWYDFLKHLDLNVYRQYVIGRYIADFYIASKSVVIELDGSGHYTEEHEKYDAERDLYMNSLGIKVLRYSNADINKNFNGICEDIMRNLNVL